MRTLKEIEWDIDMVERERCSTVIYQQSLDERLAMLDRRRASLEKERLELLGVESS